jgi:hypothetical protein
VPACAEGLLQMVRAALCMQGLCAVWLPLHARGLLRLQQLLLVRMQRQEGERGEQGGGHTQ